MGAIDSTAGRLQLFASEDASGSPVVAAHGDIDINTVEQLHTSLLARVEASRTRSGTATGIVLDLTGVVFFGSVAPEPVSYTHV